MAKQTEQPNTGLKNLKTALKTGDFARLYFFYGEERYLLEYYLSALRKKLVDGPLEDFNYRRLTPETVNVQSLRDAVEAMPMMAEKTMVQVDDYDPFAQDETTRTRLTELFSDLPDYCCLVFCYDTVPYSRSGKYKKLAEAIAQFGCEVEFPKQTAAELSDWITRHFRNYGKTISPDLCQYLIFVTGGTMTAMGMEIEKIACYSQAPAITKSDILAVVEPVLTAVMFDITDALAAGDYDTALSKLQDLLRQREEPISVLAAVGSHFRRLLSAKTVLSAGKGTETLMGMLNTGSDYYARKILSQAGRISEERIRQAVLLCFETDRQMKSSADDPARLLELLLLRLAQEETP